MSENILSLLELNNLVRRGIEACLPDTYWIQAEISDVRSNTSGHCYLEFIQKDERTSSLIAKARGVIWSNVFHVLRPYFEETTGETFHSGLKVLVEVEVTFHELYGYSLTVQNIDPTYTLGDMVKRRTDILKQLEEEGVLTLNKELELPLLTQRIAVISSATAAGYGDFCDQLKGNSWGISFYTELFPAIMQGEQVERTILNALDAILARKKDFDVVVIIRGGGATSDLSGFDTYLLAASCAQFPMPIITGIGHERDDTVLDVVANTRVKTPTAAAEFLVNRMMNVIGRLNDLSFQLKTSVVQKLQMETERLNRLIARLPSNVNLSIANENFKVKDLYNRLKLSTNLYLKDQQYLLRSISLEIKSISPYEILKKGYALLSQNGVIISSIKDIEEDSDIIIKMYDGESKAHIEKKTEYE
ncbi:Exonuclease VII, large subunit [Bacteroides coprosuis DSM 18011]|uniref:Exodeoxyribonuclease 7 large subunit n=1 Tax=Bacteroides coprosuis DSM 18011 TaxID=679937 RepID=F3ZPM7_9BACE|nr:MULTISPECIES: exodeoxyribonuclease VII large subunit [Bacteroides]EGJ70386.1 Exonuclease VII, large subunit [Bacteroides coprosuis DSM 18011]HJD91243.1 exodeoxyribonuclease VII large subunit [Bacteroides coprosuis]